MRLLVIRLSALGDVAILAPVLRARAATNPDCTFLLAAPALLQPLFDGIPNMEFVATPRNISADEMARLWIALKPDAVADMHGIRRVRHALRIMRRKGYRGAIHHVCKYRLQRWRLIRRYGKRRQQLPEAWRRYDDVFQACDLLPAPQLASEATHYWPHRSATTRRIGLAPGAQHQGKIWPVGQMELLVGILSADSRNELLLFGGRDDQPLLDRWATTYPNTRSLAAKGSFADELQAIASLDVMVSMDSANMHFASAMGVPVVSLWGATHPMAGFYGWRQQPEWAVQHDLPCRPCSAYGQKSCRYGDYRCMTEIAPQEVADRVERLLSGEINDKR